MQFKGVFVDYYYVYNLAGCTFFYILNTYIFIIIINFYVKHLQTSREEYSEMEYVVRRRYNDFVWLRQKLIDAFPTHVVPVSILQPRLNYI